MSETYRTWDIGDPEPDDVTAVESMCGIFDDEDSKPLRFGRTYDGEWKAYLDGKLYVSWDEVVRRFGPVRTAK